MNPTPTPRKPHLLRRAGFTLVETVLAIGIVATVMVALLGLLPSGVDIMSEAGRETVGARIAQQIISEVQLSEFDEVDQFNGEERFYDDMGTEVDNFKHPRRVYTARVEVASDKPSVPGSVESEFLRSVVVKISDRPIDPDFTDDGAGRDYTRYSTLVVDNEKED